MNFFPQRPETNPMIYAYQDTNPQYAGLLKVGYTSVDVEKRVAEQYPTKRPGRFGAVSHSFCRERNVS